MTSSTNDFVLKLKKSYVFDLKKPEIDRFERAQIIRSIIEEEGISVRTFAEKYGVHRSSVEDWLLYERIDEQEFRRLRDQGVSLTAIYTNLREKKTLQPSKSEIDYFLQQIKVHSKHYRKVDIKQSDKTIILVKEAIEELKNLSTKLESEQKNTKKESK